MVSGNYVSGYDIWANLTKITVSKCSTPTLNVTINNQNRISSSGFTYDAAGNLTAQSGATYQYDAENRLTSTAGVTYTYDGDGRRVRKSNGTLYWYGVSGEVLLETDLTGNNPMEYVFFGGKRVARRTSSGTIYYYFEDHLGTSRVIVQAGQNTACYEADFYPFGTERPPITNTCPQNYKFTGKERDGESGLDYFGARYYASNLGRFSIPDPLMASGKQSSPQSWNRYAYVLNSPLRLIDPYGLASANFGTKLSPYNQNLYGMWKTLSRSEGLDDPSDPRHRRKECDDPGRCGSTLPGHGIHDGYPESGRPTYIREGQGADSGTTQLLAQSQTIGDELREGKITLFGGILEVSASGTLGIPTLSSSGDLSATFGLVPPWVNVGVSVDFTLFPPSDDQPIVVLPYIGLNRHTSVGTNIVRTPEGEHVMQGINVSVSPPAASWGAAMGVSIPLANLQDLIFEILVH